MKLYYDSAYRITNSDDAVLVVEFNQHGFLVGADRQDMVTEEVTPYDLDKVRASHKKRWLRDYQGMLETSQEGA